mgnify:CR=1 FL=1
MNYQGSKRKHIVYGVYSVYLYLASVKYIFNFSFFYSYTLGLFVFTVCNYSDFNNEKT